VNDGSADDAMNMSVRVYCAHHRRQMLATTFWSDWSDYGHGERVTEWCEHRGLSRRQEEQARVELGGIPPLTTRPSSAVARPTGAVYMLQCPRCGVNARVRADVLTSVLDVLVSTGNDSVTLQYINRLAAAVDTLGKVRNFRTFRQRLTN
jgi:hypothetical protein